MVLYKVVFEEPAISAVRYFAFEDELKVLKELHSRYACSILSLEKIGQVEVIPKG